MEKILSEGEIHENRVIWIEALESNKYPQARFKLFNGKGYCCLGVAEKVLTEESPFEKTPGTEISIIANRSRYSKIRNLLGLSKDDELLFIRYNDNQKLSFPQIAQKAREMWGIKS